MRDVWVLCLAALLAGCSSRAPEPPPASGAKSASTSAAATAPTGMVEITEVDFTAEVVPPERLRVLGVGLGMTRAEAEVALRATGRYDGKEDSFNPTRLYVYDRTRGEGDDACVLYLIWAPGQTGLERISVFRPFGDRLVGEARALLTTDVLDGGSGVRKRLGEPDDEAVTLDAPLASLKHTSYFYRRRGLIVTRQVDTAAHTERVVFGISTRWDKR
jgi:hypothetical protein